MTERSNPSSASSSPPPRKFELALDELETIIEKLESGQVGLEDCLVEYERGRKLIVECETILSRVRDRIAELSVGPDGALKETASAKPAPAKPEKTDSDTPF